MKNIIRCTLFGTILLMAVACKRHDPALDKAHQEALEMTETMRMTHKGMVEKLDFMKKENSEMAAKMDQLERPDSLLAAAVVQTEAIIAHYQALADSQKELIAQNEDFLKKHEKSKVTAAEMQAQRQQIALNFETVQKEAASLLKQVEDMKTKHLIVDPSAAGQ